FQYCTQTRVVAVPPTNTLGLREVVPPTNFLPGNRGDHLHQLVDRDQPVLPQVERLAMAGHHKPVNAFDAIIDVAVRPRLIAVAPHLDLVPVIRERDLATDRRRRLLAATVVRSQRTEDVVEANYPRLEPVVLEIMPALTLRIELLPPIAVLGV